MGVALIRRNLQQSLNLWDHNTAKRVSVAGVLQGEVMPDREQKPRTAEPRLLADSAAGWSQMTKSSQANRACSVRVNVTPAHFNPLTLEACTSERLHVLLPNI